MTDIKPKQTDIVFQHNAIGRAVHTLPMYLRRLVAVAMARIKWDDGMEVRFSLADAMGALDIAPDTRTKQAFRISMLDAARQIVEVDETETTGKWRAYPWFAFIEIDQNTDELTMKFNPDLKPYLSDFSERFAMFQICDFGKLTGEYTQKIFDLAISFRGHAGQEGNKRGAWFFEYTLPELRGLLNIQPGKYADTNNFRRRVIDGSIKQINDADIGLRIDCEYKYKGKTLNAIKFVCKNISRADPRPVNPATETEKEYIELQQKYPKEYKKLYDEFMSQKNLDGTPLEPSEVDAMVVKELLLTRKR